jgi:gliding motility-associated protein GldE
MAIPIDVIRRTPPVSWLKALLVNGTSFIGKAGKKNLKISSDELEQAIAITTEESTSEDEQRLLEGIVKFGKTEAIQIMTPRIEASSFPEHFTFNQVVAFVIEAGYSRIPVYQESADNVIGILYIKDLLPHLKNNGDFDWKTLLRKPFFIPENKKIDDLLQEFRSMKMHLAVVVDEYGGASGIVTLEDILEEIVGDITDEFDDDQVDYKRLDDGSFLFEGRTSLMDFYKIIDLDGDEFEAMKGDAETLGGFIVEQSGRILKNKEYIVQGNFKFTVVSSDKRRIKWVKVQQN